MNKNKIFKYAFLAVVIAIVILVFAQARIGNNLQSKIDDAGYEYADLNVNLLFGNLEIEGLAIKNQPDHADSIQEYCFIEKVKIDGISYWDYLIHDRITIHKVWVQNGAVNFMPEDQKSEENDKSTLVAVGRIEVDSVHVTLIGNKDQLRWKRSEMLLSNLRIDTLSLDETKEMRFHLDALRCTEVKYRHSLDLHEISALSIESTGEDLAINDLMIKPLKSKSDFEKNVHGRKEMFDLKTNRISFDKLDWSALANNGKIAAERLKVQGSDFIIFSNQNIQSNKPKSYKALPTLRTLGSDLKYDVEHVEIKDAYIKYQSLTEGKNQAGQLYWEDIHAEINNITNDSSVIVEKPFTKFDIHSKFMGESNLQIYATFDLTSPKSEYEVKLSLDEMSMQPFNQILEDASGVRVKEGDIHHLKMDMKANEDKSTGNMDLAYSDLKVRMITDNYKESKNPLKWIGSRLLIRKHNQGSEAKPGVIDLERDTTASIWHQLWTSTFDGFKSIVFPEFMDDN